MKKSTIAKLAAFATAMLWGSTFAIGKIAAESFSASFIIALRFTVASVVLLVVAYPLRKLLNKEYCISARWIWHGNRRRAYSAERCSICY